MKPFRIFARVALAVAGLSFALSTVAISAHAQDSSKNPPPPAQDSSKNPPEAQRDSQPKYEPYRAVHDVEIGKYYLRKGDPDAAIGRFLDAIEYWENYAEPRFLLARIYDKRNEKELALRYYREYLKAAPNGEDAKTVRKRIALLSGEPAHQK
ncbi:MAG: tetratricopeptide repeat protein [Candidatus Acidiferrales bacterium]